MQTRRLYYENVYLKECQSRVMSCKQDGKRYHVILDQTVFYPEGGGQPADSGVIGDVKVADVQIMDGEIVHICTGPLICGQIVQAKIDWNRRFDMMQQHSGEHIVSGIIHKKYGYDNVGFHMGADCITIDLSGPLNKDQLKQLENQVNSYIWSNRNCQISFLSEEEKAQRIYRSKKELSGEVRLVEFPEADCCACCGLHVSQTGEIGLVKLLSVKKFHEGVRIEMLCGRQALSYLSVQEEQNRSVSVALSVKPEETAAAVSKLSKEIYDLRGDLASLKEAAFQKMAAMVAGKKNVLIEEAGLSPIDLRKCTDICMRKCDGICCLISGNDADGYKYAIGIKEGSIKEFVKEINGILQGRGGGKEQFAQGSFASDRNSIFAAFSAKGFETM